MTDPRHTLVETGLATSGAASAHKLYTCRVTAGPSTGKQVSIGGRAVIVGTHAVCDLIVDDPKVSRKHVQLQAAPEGIRIKDLESKNGTYADGVRVYDAVSPVAGTSAISVKLGDTTLRIRSAPAPSIPPSKRSRFGALAGESLAMREVFAVLELASPTEATVLLQGESGTGKELAARAIHDHSPRAEGPFVVLDCGATHPQLIESQLFGHVKGAFTGAVAERKGAFLEASGGTLFLDEIGELPLEAQAKLLRVLEAKSVTPLGSDRPVKVDVRVVAATHRDLAAMVDQQTYRFDLFHRMSVVHVAIPPLRDRLDDLPLLIASFYEGRGVDPGPIEGGPLAEMCAHKWPGNVRELRNVLERAFVLGGNAPFSRLQIWMSGGEAVQSAPVEVSLTFKEAKQKVIEAFERQYLAALMERYHDNISAASDHADINRRHLRKLLEERGLRKPE